MYRWWVNTGSDLSRLHTRRHQAIMWGNDDNNLWHHIWCKLTIVGSDNGLSPGWRQAIIWTHAGILLIGPVGTNFSEILIEIYTSSFKKIRLKISSAKWRPCCLGLNVLKTKVVSTSAVVLLIPWYNIHWVQPLLAHRDHFVNAPSQSWCYIVTQSLIGWAHSQNNPWQNSLIKQTLPWMHICRKY